VLGLAAPPPLHQIMSSGAKAGEKGANPAAASATSASAGQWGIVSSPNTSGTENNILNSVTCVATDDCWAVGYSSNGSASLTLVERWNGSAWNIVTSPNAASPMVFNQLQSVTCPSTSNCWAVGYSTDSNSVVSQTLIEHYDGSGWAIVNGPTPVGTFSVLDSVVCINATNCWAVGSSAVGPGAAQTLIEQNTGSGWAIVTSSNTSATQNNFLYGVACTSATECLAVGAYFNGSTYQTLIERNNGSGWVIVSSPNSKATEQNILASVACGGGGHCWAAGSHFNSSTGSYETLIQQYAVSNWTIISSPSPAQQNTLTSVTCASATDCWTVGASYDGSIYQTLAGQDTGSGWGIVSSANASEHNVLKGVTCVDLGDCWSVGWYLNAGTGQTLIEHYTAPSVQLNAVVSRKTHGNAGPFDVDLPITGNPGIECRSGGPNGDYTVVFNFANPLANVAGASVTNGTGSVVSDNIDPTDTHRYVVNLTGIANVQVITISLTNVADSAGNFSSAVSAQMGVLLGDVNASRRVDAADVSLVRQQTLQPVTSSNFRADINASGRIDAADVSIARQQTLTSLVSTP
jgi:hypothetical protein